MLSDHQDMAGCRKPVCRRYGVSPILSAAITSAIILAAGLTIYFIVMGFSGTWALGFQREVDRSVAKYQLALSVDYIELLPNGNVSVWVRNYGEAAAVILDAYAYLPEAAPSVGHRITMSFEVPVGGVRNINVTCYGCGDELEGEDLVIRIYAIPERLYDPEKPETYTQFGQYFAFRMRVSET